MAPRHALLGNTLQKVVHVYLASSTPTPFCLDQIDCRPVRLPNDVEKQEGELE